MDEFLFDDFFVTDDDPGISYVVTVRGRAVPIVVRRGLTLADKDAILRASVKTHIGPSGLVVDDVDNQAATVTLLVRAIKSWPFTYRDGTPVPVTADTVARLLSDVAEQLAAFVQGGAETLRVQASGPFAATSAPPSAAGAASDPSSLPAASPSA